MVAVEIICGIVTLIVIRLVYLLIKIYTSECKFLNDSSSLKTMLCIGSGGHTTELLRVTKNLNSYKYQPKLYIVADNDTSSEVKIHRIENENKAYNINKIPRSRSVNQSYTSSIVSTLNAMVHTIPLVYKFKPAIIFCNGPGTCIPICVVAFVFRCLFLLDCRIVFIESICRVRTLSLTGKILQYFVDIFVVQWPQLKDICFRAKYFGRLT